MVAGGAADCPALERLAGVQAVQPLSRLNRAHPGKDTTCVIDFVNDPADVLAAFKSDHTAAERSATTDANLVHDLRAYLRLYTFLSQIFDYGNTAIEKRAIFCRRSARRRSGWASRTCC